MPFLVVTLTLLSALFHAGWNIVARKNDGREIFLRVHFLIVVFGLAPALAVNFFGEPFPSTAWTYILLSGIFFAIYCLGLASGYGIGDFTVVYPLARALPVLFIAVTDFAMGHPFSLYGWIGIFLVFLGCIITPLTSLKNYSLALYWNKTTFWIIVAALGTIGYTIFDNLAADLIQPGLFSAIRYNIFEISVGFVIYWLLLKLIQQPTINLKKWDSWREPVVMAILLFSTYSLILFAFQLSLNTSYILALRQFSIVIGVVIATFRFQESAPALRISAAVIITIGIGFITLAG